METLAFAVVVIALAAPGLIFAVMSYRAPAPLSVTEPLPEPHGRAAAQ